MKRNIVICILMLIFFMTFNQANAQEPKAASITTENKIGRITWLFADSASSSVIFYNAFKDIYVKNNELYEYDLNDPTEAEQTLIEIFSALHKDFLDCYNDPEEEHTVVMGFVREDQITEFQIYILSVGFSVQSIDIDFVFICNTVNDEQALFCNIANHKEK